MALWIAYPCHPLPEGELGRMRDCPSAGCYSAIEGLLGVGDIEGARFLAAWIAFFAVLTCRPALWPILSEARMPLLSLFAYGIGGLLAAAVHSGQLEAGALGYLAALAGVVAIAGLGLVRGFRPE